MSREILQPPGWARPRGYANGVAAEGRQVFVAGQIGWDAGQRFVGDGFAAQVRQALANVVAVLACAGAGPGHIVRMTWYVTSRDEYNAARGNRRRIPRTDRPPLSRDVCSRRRRTPRAARQGRDRGHRRRLNVIARPAPDGLRDGAPSRR
jgi:enamine deaminase RidA (YjgF/YER057c/UK114 family)